MPHSLRHWSFRAPRALLATLVALTALSVPSAHATSLEADFENPPVAARPYVWWHWMGSNFSLDGITRDLESMAASGIGGATIFNLTSAVQESHAPTLDNPWPSQTYRSPEYWAALRHAASEADRLGLEIGLHNSSGYSTTGGPWIDEEQGMQRLLWTEASVTGGSRVSALLPVPEIPNYKGWGQTGTKLSFFRDVAVLAVPVTAPDSPPVSPDGVLDVSRHLSADGAFTWDAPPGEWRLYRFVHAPTGASTHPVPDDILGRSLEVDKLSLAQNRRHWNEVIDPLRQHLGPFYGSSFRHLLIDSYEAGQQTWTPAFRAEFQKRKGYDPLPWLVTLGPPITANSRQPRVRILGSESDTARFEWDYRDVVASLYQENSWQAGADLIRASGVKLQFEPYSGPFDTIAATTVADLPMGEFWTNGKGNVSGTILASARASGVHLLGAEAFTGRPEISQWTETPGFLKKSADGAFGTGVNRMILHHWVHQPFDDRYQPGMGMGWWGTHFGRNQTWAEPGKAFYRYLGRVQSLLQRGETPVHFLSVGAAAGGDAIPRSAFLAGLPVVDGRIVLPSGRSYAFLHLPHSGALLPEELHALERLLALGAHVVSPRPSRSPSLAGQPAADAEVLSLAESLWAGPAGDLHPVGPGFLHRHGDPSRALAALRREPFHRLAGNDLEDVRVQHRRDGDTDLYFVANLNNSPRRVTLSALGTGRQPELWDAYLGSRADAPLWRAAAGRTEVDLVLGAEKSVFVILRRPLPPAADPLVALDAPAGTTLTANAKGQPVVSASTAITGTARFASGRTRAFDLAPAAAVTLENAWEVTLTPKLGAVSKLPLPALVSLSSLPDPAAKYFSGTATYRATITIPAAQLAPGKRLHLDLGKVRDLVRVSVNARDLGVLWHGPFILDVTDALKPGENTLELAVTNTWHNRLVGDEQEPADFEFGRDRGPKMGRALKGYPAWFLQNKPRPSTGRVGFVNWFYHRADTPLLPSGLLGPVRLVPVAETILQP